MDTAQVQIHYDKNKAEGMGATITEFASIQSSSVSLDGDRRGRRRYLLPDAMDDQFLNALFNPSRCKDLKEPSVSSKDNSNLTKKNEEVQKKLTGVLAKRDREMQHCGRNSLLNRNRGVPSEDTLLVEAQRLVRTIIETKHPNRQVPQYRRGAFIGPEDIFRAHQQRCLTGEVCRFRFFAQGDKIVSKAA